MISDIRQAASKLQAAIQSFPSRPEPSSAVQSRPELSRPLPNPSKPSRAFQIRSRAASRAPSNAVQSPARAHPEPLQSFPDAQNSPEPTPELPKAVQNKPEPPRDLRRPPRTFHNLPKQTEIAYVEQPSRAGQSDPDSSSARGLQSNPEPSPNGVAMGPSLYV